MSPKPKPQHDEDRWLYVLSSRTYRPSTVRVEVMRVRSNGTFATIMLEAVSGPDTVPAEPSNVLLCSGATNAIKNAINEASRSAVWDRTYASLISA